MGKPEMINCFQVSSRSWSSPVREPFLAFLLSLWNDLDEEMGEKIHKKPKNLGSVRTWMEKRGEGMVGCQQRAVVGGVCGVRRWDGERQAPSGPGATAARKAQACVG